MLELDAMLLVDANLAKDVYLTTRLPPQENEMAKLGLLGDALYTSVPKA